MRKKSTVIITIILISFGSMTNMVFAQESLSWKSDYTIGILDSSNDSLISVQVTTFSSDSLQLEWQKPDVTKNQKIIGYEILRKEINSDYQSIVKITNSKNTSYIDRDLNEGYYGYIIIPVLEKIELDKIPMQGINRQHDLFSAYMKGQQLLAQQTLEKSCIRCFDESFEEIDNIFAYEFSDEDKRTRPNQQLNIKSEISKAMQYFDILFNVKNNH